MEHNCTFYGTFTERICVFQHVESKPYYNYPVSLLQVLPRCRQRRGSAFHREDRSTAVEPTLLTGPLLPSTHSLLASSSSVLRFFNAFANFAICTDILCNCLLFLVHGVVICMCVAAGQW
jgi:hypothetical protein